MKWISVNEALPELCNNDEQATRTAKFVEAKTPTGVERAVYLPKNFLGMVGFEGGYLPAGWYIANENEVRIVTVTHWRPISDKQSIWGKVKQLFIK